MEEKIKHRIITGITFVLLVGLLIQSQVNKPIEDPGEYNYCIEWAGIYPIHRSTLIKECYNFKTNDFICTWDFDSYDNLITYDYYNQTKVLNTFSCKRYVKTITKRVLLEVTPENIQRQLDEGS